MDLISYDDVVKHLKKTNRVPNLLMGNGFSISYNPSIFSYNALSSFIDSTNDKDLKTLFQVIKTSNFEQIMKEIDLFTKLIEAFDNQSDIKEKLKVLSDKLKKYFLQIMIYYYIGF